MEHCPSLNVSVVETPADPSVGGAVLGEEHV